MFIKSLEDYFGKFILYLNMIQHHMFSTRGEQN